MWNVLAFEHIWLLQIYAQRSPRRTNSCECWKLTKMFNRPNGWEIEVYETQQKQRDSWQCIGSIHSVPVPMPVIYDLNGKIKCASEQQKVSICRREKSFLKGTYSGGRWWWQRQRKSRFFLCVYEKNNKLNERITVYVRKDTQIAWNLCVFVCVCVSMRWKIFN